MLYIESFYAKIEIICLTSEQKKPIFVIYYKPRMKE